MAGRALTLLEGRNFIRRVRRAMGGKAFPYLMVAEQHRDGHWHLHLALGFWLPKSKYAEVWGRGFVDVRRFGSGKSRAAARRAAAYVAKYAVKRAVDDAPEYTQSYRCGEGFAPAVAVLVGLREVSEALALATELVGGPVQVLWDSCEAEDWRGPPTLWVQYG